jgi:hypothetical protein
MEHTRIFGRDYLDYVTSFLGYTLQIAYLFVEIFFIFTENLKPDFIDFAIIKAVKEV